MNKTKTLKSVTLEIWEDFAPGILLLGFGVALIAFLAVTVIASEWSADQAAIACIQQGMEWIDGDCKTSE